jgi:hypothetical protein
MPLSNYGELKTELAALLHRTDLTDYLPYFIQYAETVIGGDPEPNSMDALPGIRVRNQHKRVTATLASQYLDTPTDMLAIKDIQINTSPLRTLTYLSPKQLTAKFPSSPAGTPSHYTVHGDEFQFSHVPDTSLTLEVSYIARYNAFSADGDTNWLLTNHPFAYLYAAMIAGSAHVDTEDPAKWAALYKTIAFGINHTEKNGNYGANLASRPHTATP